MSNKDVSNIFNDVYAWWKKYRDINITPRSKEWKDIMQDVDEIIRKYEAEELVSLMFKGLIRILENRAKEAEIGLYKSTSPTSLDGRRDQTGVRADGRSADDRKDI